MSAAPRTSRVLTCLVAGVATLALTAAPAAARPDPGHANTTTTAAQPTDPDRRFLDPRTFPLRRVGAHLVHGDYLAGGVPAPAYIPEG